MPSRTPSSARRTLSQADEERKAFGLILRDIRLDTGMTGREWAVATGMRNTKVSRIEHGRQNPSEEDIRIWCIKGGVARRIPELIARHREIEQMWYEYRRELRAGQVRIQSASDTLYESTELLRVYESNTVPGILMIRPYVVASLTMAANLHGLPVDDIEAAADARLVRQRLVTENTGTNRFHFLVEFGGLEKGFGGLDVMHEQLDFLRRVARLWHVRLGIIPPRPQRQVRAGECFYLFDDKLVRSEMWTGGFRSKRPDQVEFFARLHAMLASMAVYGDDADALIERARELLQTQENL